jgi:hypothetical protein
MDPLRAAEDLPLPAPPDGPGGVLEHVNYRGHGNVGDLICHRPEPGYIISYWQPTPQEINRIAAGDPIALHLWTEPIPPAAISVESEVLIDQRPNRFRNTPELDDPERQT